MRVFDRAGNAPEPADGADGVVRFEHPPRSGRPGASGDPSLGHTFDDVFLHHWHTVYAVLFRLVGTREEAEDLAQEAFLRLYQKPPHDSGSPNVGGWLYRVATNLGYNALRSRRRRDAREARMMDSPAPTQPLEQVLAAEEAAEIRGALAQLGERQQGVLVLRYQGFSYAEIAEALGVSPSSIGTILARAEAELRRRYLESRGGL